MGTPSTSHSGSGLTEKMTAAGGVLIVRNVLATVMSIVGNIAVVRFLGFSMYGLQGVAQFFMMILPTLAGLRISFFLFRKPDELTRDDLKTAFTLLQILGWPTFLFTIFIAGPLTARWYHNTDLFWLMFASAVGMPLGAFGAIPAMLLEREMSYVKVSIVELVSLAGYYVPTCVMAYMGYGVWSLVWGEISRNVVSTIFSFFMRPFPLGFRWKKDSVAEMLRFGFSSSASTVVWTLSAGINPILVGKIVGLEAVGIVRLAMGIIGQLSFFSDIVTRLSFNVLGKIQEHRERVLRGVNHIALYNYVLVACPLILAASVSYWLIPLLYGAKGLESARYLSLFVVPQTLLLFWGGQSQLLTVAGRNRELIVLQVIRTILMWGLSFAFIRTFGMYVIPLAEFAVMPAFYLIHHTMKELYGRPSYFDNFVLLAAGLLGVLVSWRIRLPLFSGILFPLVFTAGVFPLISPSTKNLFRGMLRLARIRVF